MINTQLDTSETRIQELFAKSPFINGNDCTVAVPNPQGWVVHFDDEHYRNLRAGHVTAVISFLSSETGDNFHNAVLKIYDLYKLLEKYQGLYRLILDVDDLERAREQRQVGFIMGFLTSTTIEDDVRLLTIVHRLGIRVMHLTYQRSNLVGDGCGDRKDGGLTHFGVQVVQEMNRLGILIDLSHSSYRTAMDAISVSEMPVVFTHTAVRALNDHMRNASDEQIRAIAAKGGMIGIISGKFLRADIDVVGSTVDDYLNHVDYVAKLVGVDHVGIGLDVAERMTREEWMALDAHFPELFKGKTSQFDKVFSTKGLEDASLAKLNLIRGLVARGYSDNDIEKILGLNWIRVLKQVFRSSNEPN